MTSRVIFALAILFMLITRINGAFAQGLSNNNYSPNFASSSDMFLMEEEMASNMVMAGTSITINTDFPEVIILDDAVTYGNKIVFVGENPEEGQVLTIHNNDEDNAYYNEIEFKANKTTNLLFLFGKWWEATKNTEGGWDILY